MKYEELNDKQKTEIVNHLLDHNSKFNTVFYVCDKYRISKLDSFSIVNKVIDEFNIKLN